MSTTTTTNTWTAANGEPELFAGAWFADVVNGGPRMTPAQASTGDPAEKLAAPAKDH